MDWEETTDKHIAEWHQYFQNALKTEQNNQNINHSWFKCSENGIDFEMTDNEKQQYISFLVKIPEVYDKLKNWPITEQKLIVLAVAKIVSLNEKTFIEINNNDTYNLLVKMAEVTETTTSTLVKVRYMDMLCSFVEHEAGLKWLLETQYWTGIWDLAMQCQEENCDEINQNLYSIISKFLQKTSKCAPKLCQHVIKQMTQPVISSADKNYANTKKKPIEVINPKDCRNFEETIKCLIEILERLLANNDTGSETLKYFLQLQLIEACETLSILSNNNESSLQLNRVLTILCFYQMTELFDGIKVINQDPLVLSGFVKIVEREVEKKNLEGMYELLYYAQKYWINVSTKVPIQFRKEKPIDIKLELTAFQVEAISMLGEKLLKIPYGSLPESEELLRDILWGEVGHVLSEDCMKLGYKIQSELMRSPLETTLNSLKCVKKSKPLYTRNCIAMAFQCLMYAFKDFVKYIKEDVKNAGIEQNQLIAETLLEAVLVYLEDFDLSWRESLGSLELYTLNIDLFSCTKNWNSNVSLLFLKILNISTLKNLSANMLLLVDYTSDHLEGLDSMGIMLFDKCASVNMEVRETAITVVCTFCQKVNEGFNSFKRILTHYLTPDVILTIAISDTNSSIRATALTCLQEMIAMQEFEDCLSSSAFTNKILQHIAGETDPKALKVSVKLIRQIYENNKNERKDNLVNIYRIMSQVAIEEENTDVQEEAVKFWEFVMRINLERQGMIDDDFPNVTFSKEHKKIVRLDGKEIRKRLSQALDSMSKTGCFNVYRQILENSDTPTQVFATTFAIVTKLSNLLRRYDVTPEFISFNQNYPNLWSIASIAESPASNWLDNDENMKEIIEETLMEMINGEVGEFTFNDENSLASSFSDPGENLMSRDLETPIVLVSTVDFMEFIYGKLPSLNKSST